MTWMLFGCVRLRWPISDAESAASRRTALAAPRPATHASDSGSRLSSCSRATSTCSIRLPCADQLMQGRCIGRLPHRLAQALVAEHLRKLRKDLEMLLGRLLGHKQHEDQRHGLAVGRIERHGLRQAEKRTDGLLEALDPAVRDGHALPKPGGGQALASEQAVEDDAPRDAIEILEEQPRL